MAAIPRRVAVLFSGTIVAMGTVALGGALPTASAAGAATPHATSHVTHHPRAAAPRVAPASGHVNHPAAAPALPSRRPELVSAIASTFVVDTVGDPASGTSCASGHAAGTCSLRAAISAADADSGHVDAVSIPAGMGVTLSQGTLDLTNSMEITGGAGSSVNGGGSEVFDQSSSPAVQISNLAITGGVTVGDGGGILCSDGTLVLDGVTLTGNVAGYGGGIYTDSACQLWMSNSTVSANVATGSGTKAAPHGDGGGLYLYGSALIRQSVIGGTSAAAGNLAEYGAGIYNYDGDVSIVDSTVTYNSSPSTFGDGVGIYNDEVMDISGGTVSDNSAPYGADGVGINLEYVTNITGTTVDANSAGGAAATYGGGIYDDGDTTTLTDITLNGNTVHPTGGHDVYGGALLSYSYTLTWTGGSITGTSNGAAGESDYIEGGAAYLDGSFATVSNVSITGTSNNSLPNEYPEGGAIFINEYAGLNNVTISNTTNLGYEVYGGAIYNDDYSSISNTSISGTNNHATYSSGGYIGGGAIYNDGDYLAMSGVAVTGTTNLADTGSSTPSANSSEVDGGGFYNSYESTASDVSFTGTSSTAVGGKGYVEGGVVYNDESLIANNLQATNTTVTADSYVEGGIFANYDRFQGNDVTLGGATVTELGGPDAGTPTVDGSILYTDSQANLVNATMDDVTSSMPASGGYLYGVENSDSLQLTNTTIANDALSGPTGSTVLLDAASGTNSLVGLLNTIVASTTPADNCASTGGAIVSAGHNIDSGSSCGFTNVGDQSNINPMVAPLANNGGSVLTAALLPGSPAINGGTDNGCPATDGRGTPRPAGSSCDVGAYELSPGYRQIASDGGVFSFDAPFRGSLGSQHLNAPIVGMADDPQGSGYWLVASDGGVFAFGAPFHGSMGSAQLSAPIVGMAADPATGGYWLVGSDGAVYAFGAPFRGSMGGATLSAPIVAITADASTGGYWLLGSDGAVYAFGAPFHGSAAGNPLSAPIVGMAEDAATGGYWLVGSDGAVYAYGAPFRGSMGGSHLNAPIVGIAADAATGGYWLVASDGGVFAFDAPFDGSMGGHPLNKPILGVTAA